MNGKQKITESSNSFNRRPLMQNKNVYNRVIKSMVLYQLKTQGAWVPTEDLSTVMTKMVYKSNSTARRIRSMEKMLSTYAEKIKNDCKRLRLDPASEFDPPELSQRKQLSVELDEYQKFEHDLKSNAKEKSIASQEVLEDIGKKVWEVQINPSCDVDKTNHSKNNAGKHNSIQEMELNEPLNDTNSSNESEVADTSMPVIKAFGGHIFRNNQSKSPKVDNRKSVNRKLTNGKKQHLTKSILCQVDIVPSLPKPSSTKPGNSVFHDKSGVRSIDKLISDVIIVVKKRNLDARKRNTKILQQLEDYLHTIRRENLS